MPSPNASDGLFSKWIHEINPKHQVRQVTFSLRNSKISPESVSVSLLSAKLSFDKCEVGGGKEIQGQALPPQSPSGPPPDKKCSVNDVMGGAVGLCGNWPLQ